MENQTFFFQLQSSISIPSIINLNASPKHNKSSSPATTLELKEQRQPDDQECYVVRVSLDDALQTDPSSTTLYKCVKVTLILGMCLFFVPCLILFEIFS